MSECKFDRGMRDLIAVGRKKVEGLNFNHPIAVSQKALALELLRGSLVRLDETRDLVRVESEQARLAADEQRGAEAEAEDAFAALHSVIQARGLLLEAEGDGASARALQAAFDAACEGLSASSFEDLGIARTLDVLARAAAFADAHLGAEHTITQKARRALDRLRAARDAWAVEHSQASTALTRLQNLRDDLRRIYGAARHVLAGALSLDGLSNELTTLLPPIRSIYHSTGAPDPSPMITTVDVTPGLDAALTPAASAPDSHLPSE